ncbi:PREDICTED: MATH domain and coiled-coil domain-containing protein At3g58260-like [Camelina sativa]|uniref:MATH domain and coiled-coil domain-containing protein At3g58260-like n=1 Tax=Camelina sativa TaxID=90675 RepID=A0ABM0WG37_CAMSA|nr:PREDICTED: MATH domain and coiled-coil domain-containing protein At3g58260-like [Camelina sativa]
MCSNISLTTLQSWRERPPFSYSVKVKNLSELGSSTLHSDGKYQSRRFSSGDYKWRLIIYPKGNDKDNGSGFISMYVEIDSTSLVSTTPTEVYADLRFFVFNKKENKYFTIQDVESKPFNTLRTMWGFSQVLPLSTFNDNKNGYLFDGDHSEFGVDVMVAPPPAKWEILCLDVQLPYPKFSWTVKQFSEIKSDIHTSNSFSMGGMKWALKLYPKGYSIRDNKWLSIFLSLDDSEVLKEDEKVYVKANLRVQNPSGSNHLTRELNRWCDIPGVGYGWDHMVSIAELRKSYLDKEDTLIVEIEFKVVSATKYSSFT